MLVCVLPMPVAGPASAQLAPKMENLTGRYLVRGDCKIEVNQ